MANIPISPNASDVNGEIDSSDFVLVDGVIGEDIFPGAACYVSGFNSNGKPIIMLAGGPAYTSLAVAQAHVVGFSPSKLTYNAVNPPAIALVTGLEFAYCADTDPALTPGPVFLSEETKGRLKTTAPYAGAPNVGYVVKQRNLYLKQTS